MKKYNFITKELLIKEYIQNKKSIAKIAKGLKCSGRTIRDRLLKYNIKIRTKSEARKGKYKGKNNNNYIDGRKSKKYYCIGFNCNNKITYMNWLYGNRRCESCASKLRWKGKEYREKNIKSILKSLNLKPNKPEKQLIKLLNNLLLNEYKYVGNGKILFCGFNPDFINCNGQKKIIELYGDYWHNRPEVKERDNRRLIAYNRYGYKTLIVWEKELKNLNKLKSKILKFNEVK